MAAHVDLTVAHKERIVEYVNLLEEEDREAATPRKPSLQRSGAIGGLHDDAAGRSRQPLLALPAPSAWQRKERRASAPSDAPLAIKRPRLSSPPPAALERHVKRERDARQESEAKPIRPGLAWRSLASPCAPALPAPVLRLAIGDGSAYAQQGAGAGRAVKREPDGRPAPPQQERARHSAAAAPGLGALLLQQAPGDSDDSDEDSMSDGSEVPDDEVEPEHAEDASAWPPQGQPERPSGQAGQPGGQASAPQAQTWRPARQRRPRKKWTLVDLAVFAVAINKYGNEWATIERKTGLAAQDRLKDKFRNIGKAIKRNWTKMRRVDPPTELRRLFEKLWKKYPMDL